MKLVRESRGVTPLVVAHGPNRRIRGEHAARRRQPQALRARRTGGSRCLEVLSARALVRPRSFGRGGSSARSRQSDWATASVTGLEDDELEFDFFAEPETAETVERAWRPRRRSVRGENVRRRPPPPGLARISRLAALVAAVIVAVVALVSGLGACQGAGNNYPGYLGQVLAVAQSSDRVGTEFASVLRSSQKRADLGRSLQKLAVRAQQAFDQAQQIQPPGPLRQLHEELIAALELRAAGLAELSQALARAPTSGAQPSSAAEALAEEARLLTTSDVVWNELYRLPTGKQLRAYRITDLAVPPSRFISNPGLVSTPFFAQLLQRLQGLTTSSTARLLKPGASGATVKTWQRQLNRWLRTQPGQRLLPLDGAFGAQTLDATKALQKAAGITADGIVGPTTRQALTHQIARSNSHAQG
jgi:Putative peptidoglycan binding domain